MGRHSFICFVLALITIVLGTPVDCAVRQEREKCLAIHADVVTEEGSQPSWIVIEGDQIADIVCQEDKLPAKACKIDFNGYAFPGLIDTHNHVHWNVIPRWNAGRTFNNRYEWQNDPLYLANVSNVYTDRVLGANVEEEAIKYGEIRAVIGGATLIQSRYSSEQPDLLIRNLDRSYKADSFTPDIRKLDDQAKALYGAALANGDLKRVFFHLAEGRCADPLSRAEFAILRMKGLVRPGVVLIHAIALSDKELQEVKDNGMFIVWSPRCNMELYGETLDIERVLAKHIDVALAPDWAITGSSNMLDELHYANAYLASRRLNDKVTAKDLFLMVTAQAAKVAGVEDRLGRIAKGFLADIILVPKLDQDPYKSFLKTYTQDVKLVLIGGKAVFGDLALMAQLNPSCDKLNWQGRTLGLCTIDGDSSSPRNLEHFQDIKNKLMQVLPDLAPLN